jgi:hypothetical protein
VQEEAYNGAGSDNNTWEHKPLSSFREETMPSPTGSSREFFTKLPSRRRPIESRCTCPYQWFFLDAAHLQFCDPISNGVSLQIQGSYTSTPAKNLASSYLYNLHTTAPKFSNGLNK